MKIIKELDKYHTGFGGVYFIFTNICAAVIMLTAFNFSWQSTAISMADNYAYLASVNNTVRNYIAKTPAYSDKVNPTCTNTSTGGTYSILNDFNKMMGDAKFAKTLSSTATVTWTGKVTKVQFSSFEDMLGNKITPDKQSSTIENN